VPPASDPARPPGRPPASGPARARAVWASLPAERRLAAVACGGLFLSLFLPWYQVTVIARGVSSLHQLGTTFTGWGAFSFVEAAVLLVAVGVLVLLFLRADGRAFHVPGGDGGVVTAAGGWTCVLLIWRMFDKQGTTGYAQYATTSGIEWGIFVALIVAGVLAYAGTRIRLAHDPEPPLPGSDGFLGPAATERSSRPNRSNRSRRGRARDRASSSERGRSRPRRAPAGRDWSDGEDAGWSESPRAASAAAEATRALEAARATRATRATEATEALEATRAARETRATEATEATEVTRPDDSTLTTEAIRPAEAPTRRVRPSTIARPPEEPATEPLVQRLRPPRRPENDGGVDESLTIRPDDD
jgi:hypothetical protein